MIVVRLMLLFCIALLLSALKGHPMALYGPWWEIALLPTLWSAVALVTPIGTGWWWKQRIGGRAASQREQFAYEDGVELLQANAQHPLPLPSSWFVLDTPQPDAAVCGNTLMLSRGLLETDHLPAVLAHELGHLATPDGRLTAAINRLFLWMPKDRRAHGEQGSDVDDDEFLLKMILLAIRIALATIRGGFGLRITRPLWGIYWRKREYKADLYAASLGQADELADFLEVHALIHDHPVPFIWLSEHTHPPTELRVDRLRNFAHAPVGARLLSSNGHGPEQSQMLAP